MSMRCMTSVTTPVANAKARLGIWRSNMNLRRAAAKKPAKIVPMVHAICNDSNRTSTNAKSIRLNTGSVYLKVGGSKQLKATVKGVVDGRRILAEEHAPLVRYSSSNEAVATVDDSGRIRAVGKGSCTICAMTANGLYKTVKVRVR